MGGDSKRRKKINPEQYGKPIEIYYGQIYNIEEIDSSSRTIMKIYFEIEAERFACYFLLFDPSSQEKIYGVGTFLEQNEDTQTEVFIHTGQLNKLQDYIRRKFSDFYAEERSTIKKELRRRFLETDLTQVVKISRFIDGNADVPKEREILLK